MCPLPIIAWRRQRLIVPSNTLPRHLPQLPTHPLPKPPHPSQIPRIHPLNPPPTQHRIKNTSRQKRPRKIRMAPVLIVQPNPWPLPQPPLPRHLHRHNDRANRLPNAVVHGAQFRLPLPSVPPRPRHVKHRLRPTGPRRTRSHTPASAPDSSAAACSAPAARHGSISKTQSSQAPPQAPMRFERPPIGNHPPSLHPPRRLAGSRQTSQHPGQVLAICEAVPNEQNSGGRHCSDSNQTRPQIRK